MRQEVYTLKTVFFFSVLLTRTKYISEWIDVIYLGDTVGRPWKITKEEMCGRNTM